MIPSLYIAKTGMDATQTQLDVVSNNLANAATNGYKSQRAAFEDLLYQTQRAPGANSTQQTALPTGLQIGTGVRTVATARTFTQGTLNQTGNSFDLAVNGLGFLQIQMPDGTTAYTRDGSLHTDATGALVTNSGFSLQPPVTIPANAQTVTIGQDGTVSVTVQGQATPKSVGSIQLASFINPAGLDAIGQNLFQETAASGTPSTSTPGTGGMGTIQQGYVENSNVNVVTELVNMIQAQRAYELNSKAVTTSDQMLQRLTQM